MATKPEVGRVGDAARRVAAAHRSADPKPGEVDRAFPVPADPVPADPVPADPGAAGPTPAGATGPAQLARAGGRLAVLPEPGPAAGRPWTLPPSPTVVTAVAVALTLLVGLAAAAPGPGGVPLVWWPAGLLVGVLCRWRPAAWGRWGLALAAGALLSTAWAAVPGHPGHGAPALTGGSLVLGAVPAVVTALAVHRWSADRLRRPRDVVVLAGAALAAAMLAGVAVAPWLAPRVGITTADAWLLLTGSAMAAILVLAPGVLLWPVRAPGRRALAEVAALAAGGLVLLVAASAPVQSGQPRLAMLLLAAILIWLVVRFGSGPVTVLLPPMGAAIALLTAHAAVTTGSRDGLSLAVATYTQALLTVLATVSFAVAVLVEERRREYQALRDAGQLIQGVLDNADAVIYVKHFDHPGAYGRYLLVNRQFQRDLPLEPAAYLGRRDDEIFPPDQADAYRANDQAVMACGEPRTVEEAAVGLDGRPLVYLSTKFPVRDGHGRVIGVGGMSPDITERKQAEARLRATAGLLRAMFDRSPLPTLRVADPGPGIPARITEVNQALCDLLGMRADDLIGVDPQSWVVEPDQVRISDLAHAAAAQWSQAQRGQAGTGTPLTAEVGIRRPDGGLRRVQVSVAPLGVVSPEVGAPELVVHLEDVTARREAERSLTRQARHDALTGLLNRTALMDHLDGALHRLERSRGMVGVLFLDIDDFKVVNDTLGHRIGDVLLQALAGRLRGAVRPGDAVGRLGGDEFVVVCEGLGAPVEAGLVAGRVQAALVRSIEVEGHAFSLTGSIGITVSADPHSRSEDLVRRADLAMYRAKSAGKDHAEFYADELEDTAVSTLTIQHVLRQALDEDRVTVAYQPILDLKTGRPVGREALARVPGAAGDLVAPERFLGAARASGLVVRLDSYVRRRALADLAGWLRSGHLVGVSVNVDPRGLRRAGFAEEVLADLRAEHLPPDLLTLEVTEQSVLDDEGAALETLRRLRAAGVHVALDDFGTGHASLSKLRHIPADVIKIDRSFVAGLGTDPEDTAIVSAVLAIAHDLGLVVVAEGVESDEQEGRLRDLGCDQVQGYRYGRPQPLPTGGAW